MTRTRKILFGTVAAVGLGTAAFAASGVGSQTLNTAKLELISSAAAAAPGGFRGHRHGGGHGMMRVCGPQRSEKLEDGIGFVEAFFSFNAEQKTAWTGLASALRDGSEAIGKHCEAMKDGKRETTATGKLARVETMLTAGLEVVQKVRPAFDRFYATLDEKQQAALNKIIDRRGRMGRGAPRDRDDDGRRDGN